MADGGTSAAPRQPALAVERLHTAEHLQAAAELLWTVWGAKTGAERSQVISTTLLRTLVDSGNYVMGAYRDRTQLVGCSVGVFGASVGERDHLHSYITGVYQPERNRGAGFVLKRHQRAWALERGITSIRWTFDPLVRRNAYFNLCKLGATVTHYVPNFYGTMEDGTNTVDDPTDRLLVDWDLDADWVGKAMVNEWSTLRRHACVPNRAKTISVPPDADYLRRTDRGRALALRLEVRDRFVGLLDGGYRVAGMDKDRNYVLVPRDVEPSYEP